MFLQDKVVIVTGSTTGIGRAIAAKCIQEGACVLVHGRDRVRGQEVVGQLGARAVFHEADLADPESGERLVARAVECFGRLDAVVNNAAWVIRSNLESTDATLFDKIMAVNVRAPFLLIKAAVPHLVQTQGCVANVGSLNGMGGERNLFAYSVSKGALLTLSKNLADSLGPRQVRVFHFNVGWVLTENEYHYKIADGLPENWPAQVSPQQIPSGKMTSPDQIASAISFWISDHSRPFSGTVMELEQFPFEGRNPSK